MILYLDTTKPIVHLAILSDQGDELASKSFDLSNKQTAELLSKINELLLSRNLALSDISGIVCIAGPGGFTSLRVGVTMANFLSFSLNKPILGIAKGYKLPQTNLLEIIGKGHKPVLPVYSREPNITIPKAGL